MHLIQLRLRRAMHKPDHSCRVMLPCREERSVDK
jgi:hypothetical protein